MAAIIGTQTSLRLWSSQVQLDGPALVPSFNSSCCKETLLRRHVKHYNHQATALGQGFNGKVMQKMSPFGVSILWIVSSILLYLLMNSMKIDEDSMYVYVHCGYILFTIIWGMVGLLMEVPQNHPHLQWKRRWFGGTPILGTCIYVVYLLLSIIMGW